MFSRRISHKRAFLVFLAIMTMVVMWTMFGNSDADFQWVGPKTKNIRDICTSLELPIDVDWQKTTTVEQALNLLHDKLTARHVELPVLINHLALKKDGFQGDAYRVQIAVRPSTSQVSGKELLKTIIAQFPSKNVTFLVNGQMGLELTTRTEVELERAWYQKAFGVSGFDMIRQRCSEFFGGEGHLPAAPQNGRLFDQARLQHRPSATSVPARRYKTERAAWHYVFDSNRPGRAHQFTCCTVGGTATPAA